MSMSGVSIDPSCIDVYNKIKTCKTKCCLFKINDQGNKIIPVEESQLKYSRNPNPENFEKFTSLFSSKQCVYAVYNVSLACQSDSGLKTVREKIVFITWAPSSAKIKDKMLLASSSAALKKSCVGMAHDMQLGSESDLEAGEWVDSIGSMTTMKIAGEIVEFEGRSVGDW